MKVYSKTLLRVYVAGAYSADNVLEVLQNIGKGEIICAELFKEGFAPFCPWHDKDFVLRNPYTPFIIEQFYLYSITWLVVSDCVLLVPGWQRSKGTKEELRIAEELNIPVFEHIDGLLRFRDRCNVETHPTDDKA